MPILPRTSPDAGRAVEETNGARSMAGTNRTWGYVAAGLIAAIIIAGVVWVFFCSRHGLAKRRDSERTIELAPSSYRAAIGRGSQAETSSPGKLGILPDIKRRSSSGGTLVQCPVPAKLSDAARSS